MQPDKTVTRGASRQQLYGLVSLHCVTNAIAPKRIAANQTLLVGPVGAALCGVKRFIHR
jgi:hypothetical protein